MHIPGDFDIKYLYMTMTLYMACNLFICTIIFGLSESSKITLHRDFIQVIIKFKVTEKSKKKQFSAIFRLKYLSE